MKKFTFNGHPFHTSGPDKIRPDTEILESFMEFEKSAAPVFILEIGRSADWLLTRHIGATTGLKQRNPNIHNIIE
jgi:hypothetical protein